MNLPLAFKRLWEVQTFFNQLWAYWRKTNFFRISIWIGNWLLSCQLPIRILLSNIASCKFRLYFRILKWINNCRWNFVLNQRWAFWTMLFFLNQHLNWQPATELPVPIRILFSSRQIDLQLAFKTANNILEQCKLCSEAILNILEQCKHYFKSASESAMWKWVASWRYGFYFGIVKWIGYWHFKQLWAFGNSWNFFWN